jgi:hypothetical protein
MVVDISTHGVVRVRQGRTEDHDGTTSDGDWEARPALPVESLELDPDSVGMVVGERIFLDPVLRTASGDKGIRTLAPMVKL